MALRWYYAFIVILLTGCSKPRPSELLERQELSLLFVGDIMGHLSQIEAAYLEPGRYDYRESFDKISPLLQSSDVTIGNLELTLGVPPYSGYPLFSSPPELAESLKDAGFDALMTANNHSCDRGREGLEKTLKVLDEFDLEHTGTFKSERSKQRTPAFFIEKKGMRVAILNFTFYTNDIPPTPPNVVNSMDKVVIREDVSLVEKEYQPDVIIAYVHWGDQYSKIPTSWQREMNSYFNSLGVNIVIGSHPHVLQPMTFEMKQGKLVAYSLGNFISHQRSEGTDGGMALQLTFVRDEQGKVFLNGVNGKLTWVHEYFREGKPHYKVLPVSEYLGQPSYFKNSNDYQKLRSFYSNSKGFLKK